MTPEKFCLKCNSCGHAPSLDDLPCLCPECNGELDIRFDFEMLKEKIGSKNDFLSLMAPNHVPSASMWKYLDFLPIRDSGAIVSLGEGGTPILDANNLHGINCKIRFKVESGNPTGSFKDRQVSVGITNAIESGKKGVITISSGNVGAAVSGYAARAGMPAIVFVHEMSPNEKVLQILMHGAMVARVESNSTTDILHAVEEPSKLHGFGNLITASPINPYINNGAKTLAHEIVEAYLEGHQPLPDWISCPVGGGGLLAHVYKGLKELQELDLIDSMPRLIAAQSAGCAPFVNGIHRGKTVDQVLSDPWEEINTIATALADDIPLDARLAMPAIEASKGISIAVEDWKILECEEKLAKREGIFAEPSSAITLGAVEMLADRGEIDSHDDVLLLITGSGFKDLNACRRIVAKERRIPLDHDWNAFFSNMMEKKEC